MRHLTLQTSPLVSDLVWEWDVLKDSLVANTGVVVVALYFFRPGACLSRYIAAWTLGLTHMATNFFYFQDDHVLFGLVGGACDAASCQ
jgi:hypothetical protein